MDNGGNKKKAWGKFSPEKYTYGKDYTSWKSENWIAYCWHFRYKPTRMLEAGVLHGLSSIWFIDNILIHSDSKWFGIDKRLYNSRANFVSAGIPQDKMEFNMGTFEDILPKLEQGGESFDIIYCDGDKAAGNVYSLISRCWKILKPNGGLLIIDDYSYEPNERLFDLMHRRGVADQGCNPKAEIDRFLLENKGAYDLFHKEFQVILAKT